MKLGPIEIKWGSKPEPVAAPAAPAKKRRFSGAKVAPTLSDWIFHDLAADRAILADYVRLRGRSADLMRDNPWGKRFGKLLVDNVIGPVPVRMDNMADGSRNAAINVQRNALVKDAWERWQRKETCSVDRTTNYHTLETSTLRSVAQDGFAMVRLVRGFDNGWNFSLQPLSAHHLDHEMEEVRSNGNRVRAGIERNAWGEPVAYYLFQENPNDFTHATRMGPRQRVPADQILFLYIKETADQTIGVPWLAPVITKIRHLDAFEEASVVDARASACTMGIWQKKADGFAAGELEEGDEDDDFAWDGATNELEPGIILEGRDGYEWKTHDAKNPNSDIAVFANTVLQPIAGALGISSYNFSNDYSQVNFSSARMGNSTENSGWRALQNWWVEDFERAVFKEWYPLAVLSGQIDIPLRFASDIARPVWIPRGWDSPDPAKQATADEKNVKLGTDSRTRICARKGTDFDEIVAELAEENKKAEAAGVAISDIDAAMAAAPEPETEVEVEDEDGNVSTGRLRIFA